MLKRIIFYMISEYLDFRVAVPYIFCTEKIENVEIKAAIVDHPVTAD